jgi:hypothetical protein
MARTILLDEMHLIFRVPRGLTAAEGRALRRSLRRPTFLPTLTAAIRAVIRRYPSLRKVRVTVAR